MIGTRISHFELLFELGAGGMGSVYLARDLQLDRNVALKLLAGERIGDEGAQARFLREARSASALAHDHIGTIYEADAEGDHLYIAMAHYEGETLAERLRRGQVPLDEAISILRQIAAGLAAAHEAGVVHRDIKPANVMLTSDGMVKILNFGLAKPVVEDGDDSRLTVTGTTLGTVAYMSPEQARGLPVDYRTDLWSLGVIAYETLAGRPPFWGQQPVQVLLEVLTGSPNPLDRTEVPQALVELVDDLLQKQPEKRLAGAAALETALAGQKIGTRAPASWLLGAANLVLR